MLVPKHPTHTVNTPCGNILVQIIMTGVVKNRKMYIVHIVSLDSNPLIYNGCSSKLELDMQLDDINGVLHRQDTKVAIQTTMLEEKPVTSGDKRNLVSVIADTVLEFISQTSVRMIAERLWLYHKVEKDAELVGDKIATLIKAYGTLRFNWKELEKFIQDHPYETNVPGDEKQIVHDLAMQLTDLVDSSKRSINTSDVLWWAAELEFSVAQMALEEPSRSILHRSAACLYLQAGAEDHAKAVAQLGLEGDPPEEIRVELVRVAAGML